VPLRWEQLPAALRARVRAAEAAAPAPARRARRRTEGVPYRCSEPGCGWTFLWTTTDGSTPAVVTRHAADTGHASYAMVMDADA
jgi:hypothetical protein